MRLADALDDFLVAKEAANLSDRTLEFYRDNLGIFLRWLEETVAAGRVDAALWCTPGTVERFLVAERRKKKAPATIHARYRALRVFFGWLEKRHKVPSPIGDVVEPELPKTQPRQIQVEGVDRLVDAIPKGDSATWVDLRDRVLLVLFMWTGLRLKEMAGLTINHVDVKQCLLYVEKGKRNKSRYVPIPSGAPALILEYLMARPAWSGPELFLADNGAGGVRGVIQPGGIRQMIKRRCSAAGVPYANPHAFRHGFAMMLLNSGQIEMGVLSKLLGHSSTKVTQEIYADWEVASIKREYDEAVRHVRSSRQSPST